MAENFSEVLNVNLRDTEFSKEFILPVESKSTDGNTCDFRLCTDTIITVPISVLKNTKLRGSTDQNGNSILLAGLEIDTSNDVGILISQLAKEIERLAHEVRILRRRLSSKSENLDIRDENPNVSFREVIITRSTQDVTITLSGYACKTTMNDYEWGKNIKSYQPYYDTMPNDVEISIVKERPNVLRFIHNGLGLCGRSYVCNFKLAIEWES